MGFLFCQKSSNYVPSPPRKNGTASGGFVFTQVIKRRDSKAGGVAEAGSGRLASAVHDVSEQARLSNRDRNLLLRERKNAPQKGVFLF